MNGGDGGIQVQGVSKSFRGKKVLEDIQLSVPRGELFGFLGPNGAGKTTMMRIILGLLDADSGAALVGGGNFRDNPSVRSRTGVMLEGHGLYENMTLRDNIRYYGELLGVSPADCDAAITATGMSSSMDDKVGTFSTGMRKKAALARALVNRPEYLFLDEPTAGLDPEAQVEFRDLIGRLSGERGITLFLNSHNLDEVQKICGSIGIISGGRLLVSDSLDRLQQQYSDPALHITLYSEEDALSLDRMLQNNEKVRHTRVTGTKIEAVLKEEDLALKDVLGYGIDIREFTRRVKTLEEVYMEIV